MPLSPIIFIPARMGSARLPQKPLALIHGEPMILHVWRQACQAALAPVVVACDHKEIARIIEDAGGMAVVTTSHHATGSDRLAEAVALFDPEKKYNIVVNVQGDLPRFPWHRLKEILAPFEDPKVDMTTFVQSIHHGNPSSVKVKAEKSEGHSWINCLDFSRKAQNADYIHQGIYAFRREVLMTFSKLSQTEHEISESLEQLRALDHGMKIAGVVLDHEQFLSVDTPEDLQAVSSAMSASLK